MELEALIEQQNQALRAQPTTTRPQHEDRRQSPSSVYSLPPIQHAPSTQYTHAPACARTDTHPSDETRESRRHNATGLDHLADVAATSPPAADSRRSPTSISNPDIDPNLGFSTQAISFPTFPHDIFISNAQSYATPTPTKETEFEFLDSQTGALVPFGSEADGFPPKEILDIMFVRLPVCC